MGSSEPNLTEFQFQTNVMNVPDSINNDTEETNTSSKSATNNTVRFCEEVVSQLMGIKFKNYKIKKMMVEMH